MARRLNPVTPQEVRDAMLQYHERINSWRRIARIMDVSPSYAQQVAEGKLNARGDALDRWIEFQNSDAFENDRVVSEIVQVVVHDDERVRIDVSRAPGEGVYELRELT